MTHFPVAVLLPPHIELSELELAVTEVLAPYDEDGRWGADGTHWDWWVIGGRWRGELLPIANPQLIFIGRSGTYDNPPLYPNGVDALRLREVDWEGMYATRRELVRGWYRDLKQSDPFHDLRGMSEEDYLKAHVPFRPHAIVVDGRWEQPEEMGWFGVGSELREDRVWLDRWEEVISKSDQDSILVIVDCHV